MTDQPWWHELALKEGWAGDPKRTIAVYKVVAAMKDGDLQPLADYLRDGAPLDWHVRKALVEAIEAEGLAGYYRLELKRIKVGGLPPNERRRIQSRNYQIGIHHLEQRLTCEKVEDALAATMEAFDVSRNTVRNAYSDLMKLTGSAASKAVS